jgi:hypothetical protein
VTVLTIILLLFCVLYLAGRVNLLQLCPTFYARLYCARSTSMSAGIALSICNRKTRWMWMFGFTPTSFSARKKTLVPTEQGLRGHISRCGHIGKQEISCPCPRSFSRIARRGVATLTLVPSSPEVILKKKTILPTLYLRI